MLETRNDRRKIRHWRTRKKVSGSTERPRISVFKSNMNVSVQLVDDVKGVTIAASSTKALQKSKNVEGCYEVGKDIAAKAKALGITSAVFDKSGYKYHGRLAAIAKGARENGLKI